MLASSSPPSPQGLTNTDTGVKVLRPDPSKTTRGDISIVTTITMGAARVNTFSFAVGDYNLYSLLYLSVAKRLSKSITKNK
jgi:hypothetical protein